ncbi:hypothetical protein [Streptomyces sp. NPDC057284]|uniref:hypothetical protein n=1 Tax=Streptomyces sp. NPDC057284 TaxID=3346083 RepID=UPI0036271DEA
MLRGRARILRSKSPQMVRQEIYGYLLTHYALSDLRCRAATEASTNPDRIKCTRTVRITSTFSAASAVTQESSNAPATTAELRRSSSFSALDTASPKSMSPATT